MIYIYKKLLRLQHKCFIVLLLNSQRVASIPEMWLLVILLSALRVSFNVHIVNYPQLSGFVSLLKALAL
jgi:hypothetical protein